MTAEETKLMQDMVEALAVADAALTKAAAERDTLQKSASARPDYTKDMEPRSEATLDLLAKSGIPGFRFSSPDSPLRKQAKQQLLDPLRTIDMLTYAVGQLSQSREAGGDAPKPLGKSAEATAVDPNHPDHSYFGRG